MNESIMLNGRPVAGFALGQAQSKTGAPGPTWPWVLGGAVGGAVLWAALVEPMTRPYGYSEPEYPYAVTVPIAALLGGGVGYGVSKLG